MILSFVILSFMLGLTHASYAGDPSYTPNRREYGPECDGEKVATGLVCKNKCMEMKLTCRDVSPWGLYTKWGQCNYGHGTMLAAFEKGDKLKPVCKQLMFKGDNREKYYMRNCVDLKFDPNNGVGVNCAGNQVISKTVINESSGLYMISCCTDR